MIKKKRRLQHEQGPFGHVRTSLGEFEVYSATWRGGAKVTDCAVIEQRRKRGPLGEESVFRMVIDADAVREMRDGLSTWLALAEKGELRLYE